MYAVEEKMKLNDNQERDDVQVLSHVNPGLWLQKNFSFPQRKAQTGKQSLMRCNLLILEEQSDSKTTGVQIAFFVANHLISLQPSGLVAVEQYVRSHAEKIAYNIKVPTLINATEITAFMTELAKFICAWNGSVDANVANQALWVKELFSHLGL